MTGNFDLTPLIVVPFIAGILIISALFGAYSLYQYITDDTFSVENCDQVEKSIEKVYMKQQDIQGRQILIEDRLSQIDSFASQTDINYIKTQNRIILKDLEDIEENLNRF